MANAVNWFEIPATDLDRAQKFYEAVLGCELSKMEMGPFQMAMFPMEEGAPNAPGALIKGEGHVPSHTGSLVYLSVDDIEGTLSKVGENGGSVLNPKMGIGENGFVATFNDCEGNRVALHSIH